MGLLSLFLLSSPLALLLPCCRASCCGDIMRPPNIPLRPPPMPPGLNDPSVCRAYDKEINGPDYITDGKKPVSVGMIIGIIIGLLVLLIISLVAFLMAKKKNLKYQIEPENDQEKEGNFLYNYRIRGWFWRKGRKSSDKPSSRRKLFEGRQHSQASISSTSSESGYCEDAVENPENAVNEAGRRGPRNRSPNPRTGAARPLAGNEATPDIIASTQSSEAEAPKRWSLFGLLPSLKPVLLSRGVESPPPAIESQVSSDAEAADSDAPISGQSGRRRRAGDKSDSIAMRLLSVPTWITSKMSKRSRQDVAESIHEEEPQAQQASGEDEPGPTESTSEKVSRKKSRVRIKPNLKKKQNREVDV